MASPILLPDAYYPFDHCKIMTPSPGFGLVHHSWIELLGPTFSFFFQHLTQSRYLHLWTWPTVGLHLWDWPHASCMIYTPALPQVVPPMDLTHYRSYYSWDCPPIDCTIYASDPYIMYYLLWTWPPAGHTTHRTDPMSIVPFYTHDPSVVPPIWTWPTAGHIPLMHGTDPMLIVPSVHLAPAGCTPMNLSHCT